MAIVVVGDKAGHFGLGTVGEGTDATDLGLPGGQHQLVEAVIGTGTPVVVVLLNGRPFALSGIAREVGAIVEAWFPGQEGAAAIHDVLFGIVNPGGKSPLTFSTCVGVQPNVYNRKRLGEGFPAIGGIEPVFAFGHGLSYTTFSYEGLTIEPSEVPVDGSVTIGVTVTNTGAREGDEVVQLYVRDPLASTTRPVQELKGFARVSLAPGASVRVELELPADLVSLLNPGLVRVVEPGTIEVMVGSSSVDIRCKGSFELVGQVRQVGEDRRLRTAVRLLDAP